MDRIATLTKMQRSLERNQIRKIGLTFEEHEAFEIALLYGDMAADKLGHHYSALPSLSRSGPEAVKAHKNWKHFMRVREICLEREIEPARWLTAQFYIVRRWKDEIAESLNGIPTPAMLASDRASDRYRWFLDSSRRATNVGTDRTYADDCVEVMAGRMHVWEGPINLATKVKSLLDRGDEIDLSLLVLIVTTAPGRFEDAYLLTHPLLADALIAIDDPRAESLEQERKRIKGMGARYARSLEGIRRRELARMAQQYGDDYERMKEWL